SALPSPAHGNQTRKGSSLMRFTLAGVVACVAMALAATGAAWAATSPTTTAKPTTFHMVEIDHSFQFNDVAPKLKSRNDYFSAGDSFVFTSELKTPGGKHAGWLDASCTVVSGGKSGLTQCQGAFRLAGGQLIASATVTQLDGPSDIAILGGTGSYAGMRG